eukprot:SM000066S20426  [mRNA]  locus=s66:234230:235557:+ [translate_table: standard]
MTSSNTNDRQLSLNIGSDSLIPSLSLSLFFSNSNIPFIIQPHSPQYMLAHAKQAQQQQLAPACIGIAHYDATHKFQGQHALLASFAKDRMMAREPESTTDSKNRRCRQELTADHSLWQQRQISWALLQRGQPALRRGSSLQAAAAAAMAAVPPVEELEVDVKRVRLVQAERQRRSGLGDDVRGHGAKREDRRCGCRGGRLSRISDLTALTASNCNLP